MLSTAEPPVATSAPAAAPAVVAAAPAPETLNLDTFLRDSSNMPPDALLGLTPAHRQPDIVTRGRQASAKAALPAAASTASTAPVPSAPGLVVPDPVVSTPAAVPVAPVPAATPASETAPAPTPAPTAAEHTKNWRISVKDAQEALVMQAVKGGMSLKDAYQEVYGAPAASPAAATAAPAAPSSAPAVTPAPDPVKVAEQAVAKIESSVAELEQQIEKAAESGDTPAALRLMRQQNDLKITLDRAKSNREATAQQIEDQAINQAVAEHRQLENAAKAEVVKLYPALAVAESEQRAAFNQKVADLERDPAFGKDFRVKLPGWPMVVARMVAAESGWGLNAPAPVASAPGAASALPVPAPAPTTMTTQPPVSPLSPQTVPAPSTVPPVRATSASLITASESPGGATPVADKTTFWRESAGAHPSDLLALMGHAPIPAFLLRNQNRDPRRLGGV